MNDRPSHPSLRSWPDWVGLAARLIVGVVFLCAGAVKVVATDSFAHNIRAYQLLSWEISELLSYILPVIEIAVGLLLIVGLFTRWAAAATLMMLLAFIFGITWVWSNGINIDCGCFGTGGEVSAEQTQYPLKIAENVGMSALCLWLMARPRSVFSLEQALFGSPVRLDDQSDDDPVTAEDSATADIKE